jgi:hypothetical protein
MRCSPPLLLSAAVAAVAAHGPADVPPPPPHLAALFSTVARDVENMTAPVTFGAVPEWLSATKFNNGFGKFESSAGFAFNYLFDVLSYVVKWRVSGGAVTFANSLIKSDYLADSAKSIPTYRTFGGFTPPMSIAQKAETLVHDTSDNFNVNIQPFGDHDQRHGRRHGDRPRHAGDARHLLVRRQALEENLNDHVRASDAVGR